LDVCNVPLGTAGGVKENRTDCVDIAGGPKGNELKAQIDASM
jgi:hypothetical protein